MDLENLKARYYMLLGQAEEAKNIYARAAQEVSEQVKAKDQDELIKKAIREAKADTLNATPEKPVDAGTAASPTVLNQ